MGEYEERYADNGGMVQPSLQHVASCVKGVEWRLGTRGLRLVAAFSDGVSLCLAYIVDG